MSDSPPNSRSPATSYPLLVPTPPTRTEHRALRTPPQVALSTEHCALRFHTEH